VAFKTFFKSDVLPPKKAKKPWRPRARKATGERELFARVWADRPHRCEECGAPIREAAPWCFAHKLPKSTFPEFRLCDANVRLVCSLACHAAVDRQRKVKGAEWAAENEKSIRSQTGLPGEK